MEKFKYKNLIELKKMTQEEINKYYRELRKYEYENNLPVKGIKLRKKLYILIKLFLKLDKLLSKRTVTIINDQRIKNEKPKIYACTHIGRYDIESSIEAINESVWFIMGDPGETYTNIDGIFLRLNGVSWFDMGSDEEHKLDAHTVNERQIKILKNGGNEMCFPEAAWNIDPVLPVNDVHPGFVKRAIKTGAEIIPIAIEQYRTDNSKDYYLNIGKNIDLTNANIEDADKIAEDIRSTMMSLKLEIWETKKEKEEHKNWQEEYEKFIESIMCDTENGYTIEEIIRTKYTSPIHKSYINEDEVFSCLDDIEIGTKNAFLAKQKILNKK